MLSSAGRSVSGKFFVTSLRKRPTFDELAAIHRAGGDLHSDSVALHAISDLPSLLIAPDY